MHDDGVTIIDAIKAVRSLYRIDLGEAKRLVTSHPDWASETAAGDELHQVLEDTFVGLTHLGPDGRARMVDVSNKEETVRTARAGGRVRMSRAAFEAVKAGSGPKGDALAVAEIAGIMAAKRTSELIPLCHPLPLTKVAVVIEPVDADAAFDVAAEARTIGKTGVEMEAMTAVSVACLALYDMAKALDKGIVISDVRLLSKTGGKSSDYVRDSGKEA
jgi:cyclic pyranopterin phosphate synthase